MRQPLIRKLQMNREFVMPIHERPFESIGQLHENELEQFRMMFDAGTDLAVTAALNYCNKYRLNPPLWVIAESDKLQCAALRGTPKKRGRSTGTVSRYVQDGIDYRRWDTVVEVLEYRESLPEKIRSLSRSVKPSAETQRICLERNLRWTGTNDEDAFACASMLLKHTPAFGGPDAVKKSYYKVIRNSRSQSTAMRYYILDPEFLRNLGVANQPDRSDKKITHLFDLTA
jgi:hypothetical protein